MTAANLHTPTGCLSSPFLQDVGHHLVDNVQNVNKLSQLQDNLQQAAAAVRAAQGVLEQCLLAGQLINEHQLYPALCMLDKIRRKHLCRWRVEQ